MNPAVWPIASGIFLVASFFAAMAAYSLRHFSRSRLEEICNDRGRDDRFGAILKQHADAQLAMEILTATLLLALAGMGVEWHESRALNVEFPHWAEVVLEVLVFAAAVLAGVVIVPQTLSRVAGERFLFLGWPLISAARVVLRPVTAMVHGLDRVLHRATGQDATETNDVSSLQEEIRSVVDEGQREGVIESEARTMIHRVIELQEENVSTIMTPRTDMITLPGDASLEDARLRFLEAGHSRIPVIGETTDDIQGILYAKDLLKHLGGGAKPATLKEMVREPLYVPETTGIDTLLQTMKRDRVHFAIVIDEYGGVAGLVTMEDILEQIVGEIGDEHDTVEEQGIFPIEPGRLEVAAWVPIDDLNEQFNFELPDDEDYDTIGGFAVSQLGRIPQPLESFTWRQLRVTVLQADRRKIDRLRIEVDKTLSPALPEEA